MIFEKILCLAFPDPFCCTFGGLICRAILNILHIDIGCPCTPLGSLLEIKSTSGLLLSMIVIMHFFFTFSTVSLVI